MQKRIMLGNDVEIEESDRKFRCALSEQWRTLLSIDSETNVGSFKHVELPHYMHPAWCGSFLRCMCLCARVSCFVRPCSSQATMLGPGNDEAVMCLIPSAVLCSFQAPSGFASHLQCTHANCAWPYAIPATKALCSKVA